VAVQDEAETPDAHDDAPDGERFNATPVPAPPTKWSAAILADAAPFR
jgi:hypothetical protein